MFTCRFFLNRIEYSIFSGSIFKKTLGWKGFYDGAFTSDNGGGGAVFSLRHLGGRVQS
ncbi:hypothetical protein XFF6992_710013 [Xanthomonas citri pv. fuscans]|nr:hypothetical protein XFF6992_190109 [Xanthomonas citri pv. fuscans]SOO18796.1 hypothetical protein XFF6992_260105 [Xanthomonas citri pv. fuscans]SOO21698.1 hypothetical protein XFF6992_710013 [Xanthomonas citri pv. fuscans]SOO30747.1 hypothetical protein XFF6994_1150004 [Xanthomonas citri pv. fuscans]